MRRYLIIFLIVLAAAILRHGVGLHLRLILLRIHLRLLLGLLLLAARIYM